MLALIMPHRPPQPACSSRCVPMLRGQVDLQVDGGSDHARYVTERSLRRVHGCGLECHLRAYCSAQGKRCERFAGDDWLHDSQHRRGLRPAGCGATEKRAKYHGAQHRNASIDHSHCHRRSSPTRPVFSRNLNRYGLPEDAHIVPTADFSNLLRLKTRLQHGINHHIVETGRRATALPCSAAAWWWST